MSDKKISCSGLLGAFIFVVAGGAGLLFLANRGTDERKKLEETRASITLASTLPGQTTEPYIEYTTEAPDTTVPPETTTTEMTTTEASKSAEEILDEQGYMWGNKALGLAITKDCKGTVDEWSTTVYGVVTNLSGKNYSYVQVSFTIFDKSGFKVGDAWANVAGLNSGESWKFKATYLGSGGKQFRFDELTAW